MTYKSKAILVMLVVLIFVLSPFKALAFKSLEINPIKVNKAICDLRMEERRLWIDHVYWTRNFVVSDIANLEDKAEVLQRLLKNQDDIGNSIKAYYGEDAGNKLSALLREHIQIAGQVIAAAKTEVSDDFEKYNKLWYKNAEEIANFLSTINPKLSQKVLKDMFFTHLQLVTDQVTARLNKDWKADIAAFDKGEDHMIMFADIIVNGIIEQFPQKFK